MIKSDLDQLKHLNVKQYLNVKQGLRIPIINYRKNKKFAENETKSK